MKKFSDKTSFGWPGDKLPSPLSKTTQRKTSHFSGQNTHSHDTLVHVQRITERTAQMFHSRNTRGPRTAHCNVPETTCHPSVMSAMLPHLPQNTSTRSLSPASPVFRPSSHCPVLPRPVLACIKKPCEIHGGVADTLNLHLPQFRANNEVYRANGQACAIWNVHCGHPEDASAKHSRSPLVYFVVGNLNCVWYCNRRCTLLWTRRRTTATTEQQLTLVRGCEQPRDWFQRPRRRGAW